MLAYVITISLIALSAYIFGIYGGFIAFFLIIFFGIYESRKITKAKKQEMQEWTPKQLHAYAGVKTHPQDLRDYAYALAKQKEFENAFKK